ncbi:MAG: excinuclease ABC subunit UvrB [Halobacteriovoraceae bacterium]|nr:excinuclease ABC subunit UvrB [Halobacteriovoraceae bacterium]MCB9094008.1 excinuclease ABC subunit UvrB [Halobacteriovoraceae bacterium]
MVNGFELKSSYKPTGDQPEAIRSITESFQSDQIFQTLLGVTGSGKTFTMANIIQNLQKKTLILAHNKTLAAQLYEEFRSFFPENAVEYFVSYYDYYQPEAYVPGTDTFIEKDASINDDIDKLRHSATRSLLERNDVIVVSSVSCIYGIGSPEEYSKQKIKLFKGDKLNQKDFLKQLIAIQFQRNDINFTRGCFRVRGEIVEVFPSYEDQYVVRVEFFDDEIDNISFVDPLRGTTMNELSKVVIYPSTHYVVSQGYLKKAIKSIQEELRERIATLESEDKALEARRLTQRTLFDIEMLEELGYCSGIENYSRHLTGSQPGEPPPTLIDFFGDDFLLIVDESHITIPQVGGMYRGDRSRKMTLVEYGFRLPSALDNRPLNFQEFESKYDQVLFVSATPGEYELQKTKGEIVEQVIRPTGLLDPEVVLRPSKNQVDDFLIEARKAIAKNYRVLVTTLTKKLAEELTSYYKSLGLKVKYLHSDIDAIERVKILRELRQGDFDILVGINLLREGLDLPEVALVGILDADREGFLRSTRSLIQTIGRAARNSEGLVVLYGEEKTKNIAEAMQITSDRREKQIQYNLEHGITPTSIKKDIKKGMLEYLGRDSKSQRKGAQKDIDFSDLTLAELENRISALKEKMRKHAAELEFEEAAQLRDEIHELTQLRMHL